MIGKNPLSNLPRLALSAAFALILSGLFAGVALAQEGEDEEPRDTTGMPGVIHIGEPETPPEDPEDGEEPQDQTPEDGEEPQDEEPADEELPETTDDQIRTRPDGAVVIEPRHLVGNPDDEELEYHFEENFDPYNPPPYYRVQLDFPDAELTDLVMWFSGLTGQNFIIADNVHAGKRITIIGPSPVTIEEAYQAFMAALHMNGLTVVPYGSFLRIVNEDSVNQHAMPFTPPGRAPFDDRMVTQMVPLDYIAAADIIPILETLTTPAASITPYEPSNMLIITETGTNLARLMDLIETLDQPGGDSRFIYQVQHADAQQLSSTLLEVFGQDETAAPVDDRRDRRRRRDEDSAVAADEAGSGAVSVSQIIADPRTNQLIIVASPRSYGAIREMAEALDIPIAGEGQIHVLFLENANAVELSQTLTGLTQEIQSQQEEQGGRRRGSDEEGGDSVPAAGAISASLTGDVYITADEPTNSLVVVASLRDFLNLERVVDQLDRRREQVYVEAVIMEVTVTSDSTFGVALNTGALPNIGGEDIPIFAASSLGSLSSIILDPSALMGLAVGLRGPEIEGTEGLLAPGIGLPSFGAILQAIQTDSNVNVLSTPHILTTDNEEAEIIVGENIPFVTGGTGSNISSLLSQAGNLGDLDLGSLGGALPFGGGFPSFNVTRESVSLTLRIRPQINESNFVRLEIEETVESVIANDEIRGPTTSNREARTVVVVEDQQTVVIGGLIEDDITETVEKVPFLGDIPVLGMLFRRTTTRVEKRNLLLLLTPYIIRDSSDFHAIFRRKMRERQEFLEFFGREQLDYVAGVDYARKNGPLESVFLTIEAAIENEDQRRRAQGQFDGPQIAPTLDAQPIGSESGGGE